MDVRNTSVDLRTDFRQLIGGELVAGEVSLDVINPATGKVFARCPRTQLDEAVTAARRAAFEWSRKSFEQRAAAIRQMAAVRSRSLPKMPSAESSCITARSES